MVTVVDVVTALVVTAKVALVAPAGTVTLPLSGTEATAGLLLEREITAPPSGAGPLSVTVPIEGRAPAPLVGFSAREERLSAPAAAQNHNRLRVDTLPA